MRAGIIAPRPEEYPRKRGCKLFAFPVRTANMRQIAREILRAFRTLLRSPGFVLTAALTLAVGIGGTVAIFSIVNGILLKPLPYPQPERLVSVGHTAPGAGYDKVPQSIATYLYYRQENHVFEDIGIWSNDGVTVTGEDKPRELLAFLVTDGIFPILGTRPDLGRAFTESDCRSDAPRVMLLSHSYWLKAFGGAGDIVGSTMRLDGQNWEIAGVMPEDFRLMEHEPDLYLPLRIDLSQVAVGDFSYGSIARLKPGITMEKAQEELNGLLYRVPEQFPQGLSKAQLEDIRFGVRLLPLRQEVVGDIDEVLWILLGTALLVLLIACANVGHLSLVRAETRRREMAIRTALGAARWRVAGLFVGEGAILSVLGAVGGVALAYGGIRLFLALAPQGVPRLDWIHLDGASLAVALGACTLVALLLAAVSLVRSGREDVQDALREGGRGGSAGPKRHRVRYLLAASQVALALVLLVGSGLLFRSFVALRQVHPGFDRPEQVLVVQVLMSHSEMPNAQAAGATMEGILREFQAIPSVTSVGLTSSVPMDPLVNDDAVAVEEFPVAEGQLPPISRIKFVAGDILPTLGVPLLAGRLLDWNDFHQRRPVVMVSAGFAAQYWKDPRQALGKRLKGSESDWKEIVGIVGDMRDNGLAQKSPPSVYVPAVTVKWWGEDIFIQRSQMYLLRTERQPAMGLASEVEQAVWRANPNLPVAGIRTLEQIVRTSMARRFFAMAMLAIAAGAAVLLGIVGTYGVISYVVSLRFREIGIRMALGADRRDVRRLVLLQWGRVIGLGLVLGCVIAVFGSRVLASLLYGISGTDPWTYLLAAMGLGLASLLACSLPARRAVRVDPLRTLRLD